MKKKKPQSEQEDNKKQKRGLSGNAFVLISIGIVIVMILITMGGLLFFKMQIKNTVESNLKIANDKYDKYYVMISSDSNSSFWQSVFEGANEEASKDNVYVEMLGSNLSVTYSEAEQMRIAIESEVDGIILESNESQEMMSVINEAVAAGIPVVTALGDNTASARQSYVGISSYNLGREYGKQVNAIAQSYYGENTARLSRAALPLQVLVLINADADDSSQNIVFSGIQEAVENENEHMDKIDLKAKKINTDGAFAAEESIRDIFMTQDDLPSIIICLDELNTTCLYQAVVDYNKVGQINIIGYYDSNTILKAIERNVIYSTISVDTKQMGEYCVNALNEYTQSGYVSEYYAVDTTLITANNVLDYLGGENIE